MVVAATTVMAMLMVMTSTLIAGIMVTEHDGLSWHTPPHTFACRAEVAVEVKMMVKEGHPSVARTRGSVRASVQSFQWEGYDSDSQHSTAQRNTPV
jgi:hypothetical protein